MIWIQKPFCAIISTNQKPVSMYLTPQQSVLLLHHPRLKQSHLQKVQSLQCSISSYVFKLNYTKIIMRFGDQSLISFMLHITTYLRIYPNRLHLKLQKQKLSIQLFYKFKEIISLMTNCQYQGYQILETLGEGTFGKVKLARKNNKLWAIKFASKNNAYSQQIMTKIFFKEAAIVSELDHPYIIKLQQAFKQGKYAMANGKSEQRLGIVFEYMPYNLGQIMELGGLDENVARTLFQMMLSAIGYLHEKNIIHRDIKPQNILFDQHFNVKLCDFGLSAKVDPHSKPKTICGSDSFKSPEMLLKKSYNGVMNDLFALGVTLFILVFGRAPFNAATPNTGYYQFIAMNYSQKFWKGHEKRRSVSQQFKSLINSMLAFDPTHRLSVSEILSHPWMSHDTLMGDELQSEMNKRKQKLLQRKRQIYAHAQSRMMNQSSQHNTTLRCSSLGGVSLENKLLNKRPYNKILAKLTDKTIPKIKSANELRMLFNGFIGQLKMQLTEQEGQETFKIVLQKIVEQSDEKVLIEINVEEDQQFDILKFKLLEGDFILFHEMLQQFDSIMNLEGQVLAAKCQIKA